MKLLTCGWLWMYCSLKIKITKHIAIRNINQERCNEREGGREGEICYGCVRQQWWSCRAGKWQSSCLTLGVTWADHKTCSLVTWQSPPFICLFVYLPPKLSFQSSCLHVHLSALPSVCLTLCLFLACLPAQSHLPVFITCLAALHFGLAVSHFILNIRFTLTLCLQETWALSLLLLDSVLVAAAARKAKSCALQHMFFLKKLYVFDFVFSLLLHWPPLSLHFQAGYTPATPQSVTIENSYFVMYTWWNPLFWDTDMLQSICACLASVQRVQCSNNFLPYANCWLTLLIADWQTPGAYLAGSSISAEELFSSVRLNTGYLPDNNPSCTVTEVEKNYATLLGRGITG